MMENPLVHFEADRPRILQDVVHRSQNELFAKPGFDLDLLLNSTAYEENLRLKRDRGNWFTKSRLQKDRSLWGGVFGGLMAPSGQIDRKELLTKILAHYAEEIGGHFNPKVYRLATGVLPFGFSWMLNAAAVKRFNPWKLTESLNTRLRITGEVDLLKKLSQKGTILALPTHSSHVDSVLIGYIIYLMGLPPFAYGAGLNLFSNPALSFFMGNLGAYTVDRQKRNDLYKNVLKNYSTRILCEGVHSIFFPGGGRSRSGAVEKHLKLGLMGTGLEAQFENLRTGKANPNIYVVPMTMNYHFVLEAASMIEDYLAENMRMIIMDDEAWQFKKILNFFWKLFSLKSAITVRVGKPLDVFGNFVDEEGRSMGPNGTTIDPKAWLSTGGELRAVPQRDHEYTRYLGKKVGERFHKENTAQTSNLVAFSLFESIRKRYPDLTLQRFVRLTRAQRTLPYAEFLKDCEHYHQRVRALSDKGALFLSPELQTSDTEAWVKDGIEQLAQFHDPDVVHRGDQVVGVGDMNLLYYYRNRLCGYQLSLLGHTAPVTKEGHDHKGFLI